jgi:adenosylcobinamide-GDP ribazoletransferase
VNDEAPPRLPDALRFAFGTLTVLPVRVTRWDRPAARGGMALAPLVGAVVGALAAAGGGLLVALGASALLAAVAAVSIPAALTRGLHLDGLADTADGLGSGRPPAQALDIMKQSDIGPFGVVTLVLVLLAQVAALAACYGHGWRYGAASAVAAGLMGRAVMTLACRRGVPAARPGGLGAAVAGVLRPLTAWAIALGCAALALCLGAPFPGLTAVRFLAAAAVSLLCAELVLRRCRARFGGVTGDVFGALCETGSTAALLVLSLR